MQEEDIWASVALLPFSSTIAIASSNGLSVLEAALVSSSVMMNMWRTLLILFIASSIRADLHYPGDIRWVTCNSNTYAFTIQHTCMAKKEVKHWNSNNSNCIAVIFHFPPFWPWLYKIILLKTCKCCYFHSFVFTQHCQHKSKMVNVIYQVDVFYPKARSERGGPQARRASVNEAPKGPSWPSGLKRIRKKFDYTKISLYLDLSGKKA